MRGLQDVPALHMAKGARPYQMYRLNTFPAPVEAVMNGELPSTNDKHPTTRLPRRGTAITAEKDAVTSSPIGCESVTPRNGWKDNVKVRKNKIHSKSEANAPLDEAALRDRLSRALRHSASLVGLKKEATDDEKIMIEMWQEADRFLRLQDGADRVVANTMVYQFHRKYTDHPDVPSTIRDRFTCSGSQMEYQVDLITEIQEDVYGWLLLHLGHKLKDPSSMKDRSRTKSMRRDPFEDQNPKLMRYIQPPGDSQEPVLIAATTEKIIYILSDNLTGEMRGELVEVTAKVLVQILAFGRV